MSRLKKISVLIALTFTGSWILSHFISVVINVSESLPYKAFVVLKGMPIKKQEYVAFYSPHNSVYPDNKLFIKQMMGVPGDVVTEHKRNFFMNNRFMGYAKPKSKRGIALEIGPTGKIGTRQYFVHTDHKDSFDSRYKNIGWIKKEDVVGKAIPLF